jgi:hypothetical protein
MTAALRLRHPAARRPVADAGAPAAEISPADAGSEISPAAAQMGKRTRRGSSDRAAARKRRAAPSRRAATERTRRWRARRRRGRICALVELTDEQHRWLFRFGGLADHEATDRAAIARALGVLLDHAAEALRWEIARGFKKL